MGESCGFCLGGRGPNHPSGEGGPVDCVEVEVESVEVEAEGFARRVAHLEGTLADAHQARDMAEACFRDLYQKQ
jgi:hypothetical protein